MLSPDVNVLGGYPVIYVTEAVAEGGGFGTQHFICLSGLIATGERESE